MAAGAVVLRGVDAGDAVEHFARSGGAAAFEFFAADHVAGTGMFEDVVLLRRTQPVTDHGGGTELDRRTGGGKRLQAEGVVTFGAGLQAAALQQCIQTLLRAVLALQAGALHTAGDLRAERDQHAAFAAELVQGVFQAGRRDLVSARRGLGGVCANSGNAQAGAQQQGAQGLGKWTRSKGHAGGP
ncbi:hypothetical protein D3C81_702790 [compost metagenome]